MNHFSTHIQVGSPSKESGSSSERIHGAPSGQRGRSRAGEIRCTLLLWGCLLLTTTNHDVNVKTTLLKELDSNMSTNFLTQRFLILTGSLPIPQRSSFKVTIITLSPISLPEIHCKQFQSLFKCDHIPCMSVGDVTTFKITATNTNSTYRNIFPAKSLENERLL